MSKIFCNPDVCPNCQYIGEGDSICDETMEIVLSDWQPTEAFMKDCPFATSYQQVRKPHKRRNGQKATHR